MHLVIWVARVGTRIELPVFPRFSMRVFPVARPWVTGKIEAYSERYGKPFRDAGLENGEFAPKTTHGGVGEGVCQTGRD